MEQNNQTPAGVDNTVNNVAAVNPGPPSDNPTAEQSFKKPNGRNKWILPVLIVAVLTTAGAGAWFLLKDDKPSADNSQNIITSYDECVAAGYPIMESFPEQCSVPGGQTFTNTAAKDLPAEKPTEVSVACAEDLTRFADSDFGASFCYPKDWGTASVMDAKIDTEDTGYREAVRFSANTKFIVGGVSEDWATTVGRDVGCQEPSNNVPELSSYNTDWHDTVGTGMATEFATRSLESSEGGYDMTETVSNLLQSGVCVQGHKVIDGSRYRVLSEAFYTDFDDGALSPRAHMDNPSILFSFVEREQFDALLASVIAY